MAPWIAAAMVGGAALAAAAMWRRHRLRRDRLYAQLADARPDIVAAYPIEIQTGVAPGTLSVSFAHDRFARVDGFLTDNCLRRLREEAESNVGRSERSYIPTHKRGGTLSYEAIHHHAPQCLSFYHSPAVQAWVSGVVGHPVVPTPDQDQSSLSLLCYTEAGDHINWHYDHNFYRGRHFTVLLSLVNRGSNGASQSTYQRKLARGEIVSADTAANTLIVFEGAKVLHRATSTGQGDRRIMLSMTYCTDPRTSRVKEAIRRVKDTAFFGLRALWD
ncbi:MAG: hypothetical protein SH850_27065 [Planctomycetaceae bacterium]|nr:hypothetical protein [Planctomycetaceae bacterium]